MVDELFGVDAANTLMTLTGGIAAIAALGYLAAALGRGPAWQRAVWQMVLLAILGLGAAELAGPSACVTHFARAWQTSGVAEAWRAPLRRDETESLSVGIWGLQEDAFAETLPAPLVSTDELCPIGLEPPEPVAAEPAVAGGAIALPTIDRALVPPALMSLPAIADEAASRAVSSAPLMTRSPLWDDGGGERQWAGHLALSQGLSGAEETSANASSFHALGSWFLVIWLVGALLLGLRALVGSALLVRFCRRLRPVQDDALAWSAYLVARRLGMRRSVRLLEAPGLTAPMACGIARPIVALPPGFADDYCAEEQQAMLAHELAHLRGADPLWQRLADWLAVAFWWHPLVWWVRRQWRAASEATADEASLVVDGGPELLAECLVALGGRVSGARPLGWIGMRGGFRSHLGRRVERLLSLGHARWRPPRRRLWVKIVVPVALVAVTILCTSWGRSETSYQGETGMNMVKHYWRQSLLGIAMLATFQAADQALASGASAADDSAAVAAAPEQEREKPRDGDRPREGEKRDGDRPREGEKRDGDRPRPEGERRDGDRPREGEKRDGDRPRPEGEKRDGDRPRPEGERRDGDRPKEGDRPKLDGDQERQLRHLTAAAENLEAAGLHDEAARVRREISERTGKRGGPDRPPVPREGGPRDKEPLRRPLVGGGGPPEILAVIRELQQEIAQLRREMADMRRMIPRGEGRHEGAPDFRPDDGRRPGGEERTDIKRPDIKRDGDRPRPDGERRDGDRPPPKKDRERGDREDAPAPREQQ
jgi:beta-lactamase regulating signal transducer with metallopeptidase domain